MSQLSDFVVFNDSKLKRRYENAPIPMSVLYEAYFDGDIDLRGDIRELLAARQLFVKYTITRQHLQWAVTNFVPDVVAHTKHLDQKMARELYDRGTDFFAAFLGERLQYTCAMFAHPDESLAQAQENALRLTCEKLLLKPNERLLDLGCGWGELSCYAAENYGTQTTGITLSERQQDHALRAIESAGLTGQVQVFRQDYRDLVDGQFDKIVSLELIDKVGYKNLFGFCERLLTLLKDDGLLLLQWTGLRRGLRPEDLIWGLFMNKYVFPGADSALPASSMLKALEKSGWEVQSLENVSTHYSWTIRRWHENWLRNRAAVTAAYGDRWFRIWNFFLAWTALIGEQGSACCYQAVLNKSIDSFDRAQWARRSEVPLTGRVRPNITKLAAAE